MGESTEVVEQGQVGQEETQQGTSEGASESTEAPVTPEYTPNLTFKYATSDSPDSKEGKFDDFIHGVIKDQDTEKKVRELYEKAYGLDFYKPRHESLKQQYQTLSSEHSGLVSELRGVGEAIKRGDVDMALHLLNIPEDLIVKHVIDKVKYQQMTPEQRHDWDERRTAGRQAYQSESQVSQLQAALSEQAVQMRGMQLDSVLARSDTAAIAQSVDAKLGQGAFRSEVIAYATGVYSTTGRDISVEEAIQGVMKKYSPFVQLQQAAPTPTVPQAPKKVPVIPSVSGNGTSPAKKKYTSIEQLRARSKELAETDLNE